tara:strand:+ start:127 stop:432 length:306 start_codon:yes stop_codon:yes gene_type:complete
MGKNKKYSRDDKSIVKGLSCFAAHEKLNLGCKKKDCRYWHNMKDKDNLNCTIIAAKKGPMTLQQVGEIFNVTRMRICQIEKAAKKFLKNSTPDFLSDFKNS